MCCVSFTDVDAFDYHRRNDKCIHPVDVKMVKGVNKGKQRLVPSTIIRTTPDTVVWKRNDFRENHFWVDKRAG